MFIVPDELTSPPFDLWIFSSMEELENGFIRYYEKFVKLWNEEQERKDSINVLKKLGFEYSRRTNTYLKVLYISTSL